ncbi:MAG: 2-C-methyl-D-erythritol 2,4-cyclodiphosphate synthase [Clostridiales bacterium]|nr:2-C-methyl-D-erythritol 2,4-cyclodiphosphate synthase [Clostridiales bacterium]
MFDVIIVAYGKSQRAGLDKLSFDLNGKSVLDRTIDAFVGIGGINNIIVVTDRDINKKNVIVTSGGVARSQSVKCGLKLVKSPYVLIHDGARPFVSAKLIKQIMQATKEHNSAVPYIKSADSLRRIKENRLTSAVDRESIVCVQTPQGYKTSQILQAYKLNNDNLNTDESEIYAKFIEPPYALLGENSNRKITYIEDLLNIASRIGSGFDVHQFESGKQLVLGGIKIPFDKGLKAYSDGDVVIHAIMDALLSAAGERDIGIHFPDYDDKYKSIDSTKLLAKVKEILANKNAIINNITVTIMAQKPILAHYIPKMQEKIASVLQTDISSINITATTTENLGIIGEEKAIAALAIASVI